MANTNKYFSKDNIIDIIEIFEDFLEKYDVRIPASDEEIFEDYKNIRENDARIYGTVRCELEDDLLGYFEKLEKIGTVPKVVNSWDAEIEIWDKYEY